MPGVTMAKELSGQERLDGLCCACELARPSKSSARLPLGDRAADRLTQGAPPKRRQEIVDRLESLQVGIELKSAGPSVPLLAP